MARLSAGLLARARVTIEEPVGTLRPDGSPDGGWSTALGNVPASVEEQVSRDVMQARKVDARISSLVRIRFLPWLTGRHRFRYGERILNIVGAPIDPDGRRFELSCYCQETPDGR